MHDIVVSGLNRSLPIFPKEGTVLKAQEEKVIKVETPFMDEIFGQAIIKILDGVIHSTLMIQLKYM